MSGQSFVSPGIPLNLPKKIQDLSPKWAHLALKINNFLKSSPDCPGLGISLSGARLAVAFSGGADSLALLVFLRCIAASSGSEVRAFHLDHGLRPSSAAEALWCGVFCERLGVHFESRRVNVRAMQLREGGSLEECARKARYAALENFALEHGCHWVCTGHQLNDLAEDVLMRLLRGAGWPALGGMRGRDDARRLLRPLLLQQRSELEFFLQEIGLGWIEDESNNSMDFLRNRIRHRFLPLFLEENPGFLEQIGHLWQLGRVDEAFFAGLLKDQFPHETTGLDDKLSLQNSDRQPDVVEFSCSRKELTMMEMAMRLRFYKYRLESLGKGQITTQGLLALDQAILGRQFPKTLKFNGHKQVLVTGKTVVWSKS